MSDEIRKPLSVSLPARPSADTEMPPGASPCPEADPSATPPTAAADWGRLQAVARILATGAARAGVGDRDPAPQEDAEADWCA